MKTIIMALIVFCFGMFIGYLNPSGKVDAMFSGASKWVSAVGEATNDGKHIITVTGNPSPTFSSTPTISVKPALTSQAPTTKQATLDDSNLYFIPSGNSVVTRKLTTVKTWSGSSISQKLIYNATKAPWVVNAEYQPMGKLGTRFDIEVWKHTSIPDVMMRATNKSSTVGSFTYFFLIEDTGTYTIDVTASGCDWWVKVGTE